MTPRQRMEARQQLGERERFGQIVVGAGLQSFDAVVDRLLGAHDDGRRPVAFSAQGFEDRDAVHLRQREIEDDGVVGDVPPVGESVFAESGGIDDVALLAEAVADEGPDAFVVLDHKNAHRFSQ
jgi:hypothetical protein